VFGDIRDAVRHRLFDGADVDLLAVAQHLPTDAAAVGASEEAHRQFGGTGTHQARDPEDFAAPDVEVGALDHLARRLQRGVHAPVFYLEHAVAQLRRAPRVPIRHRATDHAADDVVFAGRTRPAIDGFNRHAVAQDGDRVGHLGDFVQLVRDQDAGDAVRLQVAQQIQQRVAVAL